ncbi:phosphoglycolate phosphatase [Psychromonas marina]|uniref:Phosphoglycolate phosphatase n=1 Tax=Psychromonas marina TaxID=88364 RepID=A0ABQ6DZ26_9GAMM|nr:HAD family phosphatase [Psychromonas marina]GLS90424.1 phosphoglycolate phosphatase [Psychromonas marina]
MNYQAAIFDMDGLLLDTERVCLEAFRDACYALSLPFLEQTYLGIIGRNAQGIEEVLSAGYSDKIAYPTLRAAWMDRYHPIVETQAIPVKKGVIELLEWLKSQNIPMAVATSTPKELAITKLKLAGLYGYFEQLSTGCEVKQGKPHPEIFLLAAERLQVSPEQCLVFEDSNNGVRSGIAANMQVFQIPDLVAPCAEVLKLGHIVEVSLQEVHQMLIKHASQSQGKVQ